MGYIPVITDLREGPLGVYNSGTGNGSSPAIPSQSPSSQSLTPGSPSPVSVLSPPGPQLRERDRGWAGCLAFSPRREAGGGRGWARGGLEMGLGDGETGIPFRLLLMQVREEILLALEHATPGLLVLGEEVDASPTALLPAYFSYAVPGKVDLGEGLSVEVDTELSTMHDVCGERSPLALLMRPTKEGKIFGSFEYEVSLCITDELLVFG